MIAARWLAVAARTGAGWPAMLGPGPIGRHAAQQLARRELARAIYQPGILERLLSWLTRHLIRIGANFPGGGWSLAAVAGVAIALAAGVLTYSRPGRVRTAHRGPVIADQPLTAREHRNKSSQFAAAGDYAAAIVERVRAIAAGLEERSILPPRPGRTAAELADEAAGELPAHARALRTGMGIFDDVRYGDRPGTRADYQQVSKLDDELQAARPALTAADARSATEPAVSPGVPR